MKMASVTVHAAFILLLLSGFAFALDPDSVSAPRTSSSVPAQTSQTRDASSLGTCTSADLTGKWSMIVDHDFSTPGTRQVLGFCKIRILPSGIISTTSCERQSAASTDSLTGAVKISSNCAVANKTTDPLSFDFGGALVLKIDAIMSGDRTRIEGKFIGNNSGNTRGSVNLSRLP